MNKRRENTRKLYTFFIMLGLLFTISVICMQNTYAVSSLQVFKVTVYNPNPYVLVNYQVRIDLSSLLGSPKPLKVTDSYGNSLSFCYEQASGECGIEPSRIIWVKVPFINANNAQTLYVYVSQVNYAVSGDDVFAFYDDFNSGELGGKWRYESSKVYISNGVLKIRNVREGCDVVLITRRSFKFDSKRPDLGGFRIDWRMKYYSEYANSGWDVFLPNNDLSLGDETGTMGEYFLFSPYAVGGSKLWRHEKYRWQNVEVGPRGDLNRWHIYSAIISPNFTLVLLEDGKQLLKYKEKTFTTLYGYLAFREGNHDIDWIRVRKWADQDVKVTIESKAEIVLKGSDITVKACFEGTISKCFTIDAGTSNRVELNAGAYTVRYYIEGSLDNKIIGDLSQLWIAKEYYFKSGETYTIALPGTRDFLDETGIIKIINPTNIDVDVIIAWNNGLKTVSIKKNSETYIHAVPGEYNITPKIIGLSKRGTKIYINKGGIETYTIPANIGSITIKGVSGDTVIIKWDNNEIMNTIPGNGLLVLAALEGNYTINLYRSGLLIEQKIYITKGRNITVIECPAKFTFKNPYGVPVIVNITSNNLNRTLEINPWGEERLYLINGVYQISWKPENVLGETGWLHKTINATDSQEEYNIMMYSDVGLLILRNYGSMEMAYVVTISYGSKSIELLIGVDKDKHIYVSKGTYILRIEPEKYYLKGKYYRVTELTVNPNETRILNLNEILPISHLRIKGVPSARYSIVSSNITFHGIVPARGIIEYYLPPGNTKVHLDALDIFHSPIEGVIALKQGEKVEIEATTYPLSLLSYALISLVIGAALISISVGLLKPRLEVALQSREIIAGVDEKLRLRIRNKGLLAGEFNVSVEVNGREVFRERYSFSGRESWLLVLDLGSLLRGEEAGRDG